MNKEILNQLELIDSRNTSIIGEVASSAGMVKYRTNIENVFIYKVQAGWNWPTAIRNNEKHFVSDWYKEKSIIIVYSDYIDGKFCGQTEYLYGYGTKKYSLSDLIETEDQKNYYICHQIELNAAKKEVKQLKWEIKNNITTNGLSISLGVLKSAIDELNYLKSKPVRI